jgi:hypothetical protein
VKKCRSTWRCADSELVDIDPASNCCYVPVDLNNAHLLAQNGLQPSEANPQFHQQMVYAVAMRTIARFERALARRALWAEHVVRGEDKEFVSADFVQRLRIYPHALREENATTHALLDGLHLRRRPTQRCWPSTRPLPTS